MIKSYLFNLSIHLGQDWVQYPCTMCNYSDKKNLFLHFYTFFCFLMVEIENCVLNLVIESNCT